MIPGTRLFSLVGNIRKCSRFRCLVTAFSRKRDIIPFPDIREKKPLSKYFLLIRRFTMISCSPHTPTECSAWGSIRQISPFLVTI